MVGAHVVDRIGQVAQSDTHLLSMIVDLFEELTNDLPSCSSLALSLRFAFFMTLLPVRAKEPQRAHADEDVDGGALQGADASQ